MGILDIFKKIGSFVKRAIGIVQEVVPEDLLQTAVLWVKVAANKQLDNAGKREYVVERLHAIFPGLPESVIRLAVELAVRLVKKELNQ